MPFSLFYPKSNSISQAQYLTNCIERILLAIWYGSIAQSVEQLTFNQLVRGSSPRRPTKIFIQSISKLKLNLEHTKVYYK